MRINPILEFYNGMYREPCNKFENRHIENSKHSISFSDILKQIEKDNKSIMSGKNKTQISNIRGF